MAMASVPPSYKHPPVSASLVRLLPRLVALVPGDKTGGNSLLTSLTNVCSSYKHPPVSGSLVQPVSHIAVDIPEQMLSACNFLLCLLCLHVKGLHLLPWFTLCLICCPVTPHCFFCFDWITLAYPLHAHAILARMMHPTASALSAILALLSSPGKVTNA